MAVDGKSLSTAMIILIKLINPLDIDAKNKLSVGVFLLPDKTVRNRASKGDDGADGLAGHDLVEVAVHVHVEDVDGQLVVAGHDGGSHVHDLEAAVVDLVVGDAVKLGCRGILLGVGGVDAVHAGTLEHDVGLDLDGTQRAARVGGEEGAARAAGADGDLACLHGVDGAPLAVRLTDGEHADGGEHLGGLADGFKRRRERQCINDGGEHAHLVALDAVEALRGALEAAEDVAAAHDDGYLYASVHDFLDLGGIVGHALRIDAATLFCCQRLAAEFEQYAMINRCHSLIVIVLYKKELVKTMF